jgi:vacuolar-type H+-ATPase subunit I/STV1
MSNTSKDVVSVVSAVIDVSGREVELKRSYKEVWRQRRGVNEWYLDTHETKIEIDKTPCPTVKEFVQRITDLICDEKMFKLLTNPLFFNDNDAMAKKYDMNDSKIGWVNRQNILFNMVDIVPDAVLIENNPDFAELFERLKGKSLDDHKTTIRVKKAEVKKQLEQLPGRIDEVERGKEEEPDYEEVQANLDIANKRVEEIDEILSDASNATATAQKNKSEQIKERGKLEIKLQEMENTVNAGNNSDKHESDRERTKLKNTIDDDNILIEKYDKERSENVETLAGIPATLKLCTDEINLINQETLSFDESVFKCKFCNADLDSDNIEETKEKLIANFNKDLRS